MKSVKKATKTVKRIRPSWDEYFLGISDVVASRATCDRGYSGCVIARDKRILTTGYVGSIPGAPHCDEEGHDLRRMVSENGEESWHCVRTMHAEMNAVTQAARIGVSLLGATLYCKMLPCFGCAKAIINAGISRVVARKDYHASKDTKKAFKEAGVAFEILDPKIEEYEKK